MIGDAGRSPVTACNHRPVSPGPDFQPGVGKYDMSPTEDGAEQVTLSPDTKCTSVKDPVPYAAPSNSSEPNKLVPRPTHDVPLYWTPPAKGRVGSFNIEQWKKSAGPMATAVRFAELAGQVGDAVKVSASTRSSKQPVIAQLDASYFDVSPTNTPRPLEELDLKSLADLHVHMKRAREKVPADLVIPGKIGGHCLAILVDSGATCTVLSTRKWTQIHRDNPNLTLLSDADRVQLASGASQSIQGKLLVQIELAGQYYLHQVIVMDIMEDMIMGMDFLALHDAECDWSRGILRLRGKELEACRQYSLDDGRLRRLTLVRKLTLPAGTHTIVEAKVHHHYPCDTPDWGMSTAARCSVENHGIIAGRAVVDGHADTVPIPIMNPTDTNAISSPTDTIAWLRPVDYVGYDPNACVDLGPAFNPVDPNLPPCLLSVALAQSQSLQTCVATAKHWDDSSTDEDSEPHEPTTESPLTQGVDLAGQYSIPEHLRTLYTTSLRDLETETQAQQLANFFHDYQDVFATSAEDLGRTNIVQHRIDTGDHPPIKQHPRRIPIHKCEFVHQEIQNMLQKGVIEPCDGPWSSPIVLAAKKGGETRFCVDFRLLNEVTKKDAYALTRIEDNLDALQGAQWYSTLDLLSGFWQVEVSPEDRDKTAFSIGGSGLWNFVTMPFGLCNAPSTFSRLMELVLAGLQWNIAVLYLDDIVVFANDFTQHVQRLGQVLSRLRQAGLKLKPSKCNLLRKKVEFLGHIVSAQGVEVDPEKVEKVVNWPVPQNLMDVRSFLGLCAYYRRFIPDFSLVAKPLTMLSEKDVIFEWTGSQQVAFEQLKKLLTRTPILAYPKDGCPYILDTDASNVGLGGVLSQVQDGEERVIAYASKTLNRAQRNYCVTRRELLAIVTFVKQFHHYLYEAPFLVRTDHAALYWLLRKNDPDGQMARWIEVLQNYDMTVEHRPGKKHGNADALSRCMFGCQLTDTLNLEPGNHADLKEITKRAQIVFPEWPPQEHKELLCQADPGQSSQEAQQLAIQNAKLQPVQTRAQARKDRQQAQQEDDLALG